MWESVFDTISSSIGRSFDAKQRVSIGGGCISESFRLSDGYIDFFVKRHHASMAGMFESECKALEQLAATRTLCVPKPLGWGESEGYAWLVTDYLEMQSCVGDPQRELGKQLARLHRIRQPYFGWCRDNTIGRTPQPNPRSDDWVAFWRDHRLGWQFDLARRRGRGFAGSDQLVGVLEVFFTDYEPIPSLLHGDLWSGNMAALKSGVPVVFDPASYYGDAEAEFGMVDMFGGFTDDFYRGYAAEKPFAAGFDSRRDLYRLYHELNHFNLFGSTYASSCESTINRLLKKI
jgi:protein-ribulosamine 3-kinase